jgi:hypothetical protein
VPELVKSVDEGGFSMVDVSDNGNVSWGYINHALNSNYEALRSEICHQLKDQGDIEFLQQLLGSDQVEKLYRRRLYFHCFYLVGLADYLCRIHQLPLCSEYEEIRGHRLRKTAVPLSLELLAKVDPENPEYLKAQNAAIPEFAHFNILEGNVRDAL